MKNFKRIAAAVSALAIMSTATTYSISAFAAGEEYDFNSDGVTNSMDMSVFGKYLLTDGGTKSMASTGSVENDKYFENIELTDDAIAKIKEVGDVNNDKKIDGNDSFDLIKKFFEEGIYETDVNRDGKFDKYDTQSVMDYYAAVQVDKVEIDYTAEERDFISENCNYDGNYQIDGLDASLLYSYLQTVLRASYKMGDTNLDGAVDAVDASNILEYYALDSTSFTDEYSRSKRNTISGLGDINNDGNINALDASLILTSYADAQTK